MSEEKAVKNSPAAFCGHTDQKQGGYDILYHSLMNLLYCNWYLV